MTPCPEIPDRTAALLLIVHVLALFGGFTALGLVFDFPEVLRYPAAERFALFAENESLVRATYWLLTMTGVTQIAIAVLLFHLTRGGRLVASTVALIFGTLAGLCQAMGFGRWVIVIPWLVAEAGTATDVANAALLEGTLNRYAGMLVGEHLANVFWGIWLAAVNIALLRATDLDRGLCRFGLALAPLLFVLAGEQIGVSGAILDPLVDIGFPLLAFWHLLLAAQLLRRHGRERFPRLGAKLTVGGGIVVAGMIASALV